MSRPTHKGALHRTLTLLFARRGRIEERIADLMEQRVTVEEKIAEVIQQIGEDAAAAHRARRGGR